MIEEYKVHTISLIPNDKIDMEKGYYHGVYVLVHFTNDYRLKQVILLAISYKSFGISTNHQAKNFIFSIICLIHSKPAPKESKTQELQNNMLYASESIIVLR